MNNKTIFLRSIFALSILSFSGYEFLTATSTSQAPHIEHFSWGKTIVRHADGTQFTYGDCKIMPSSSKKWDWRETGTHHRPGIQIADVQELADSADIIILTRGVDLVLQTKPETIEYLKKRGKHVHVEQTEKAVALYNTLIKENKKVAILLHSTC